MRILFFTKYTNKGPSSRYRTYNYLRFYREYKVYSFHDDSYSPKASFILKYLFKIYFRRLYNILKIKKNDIVFVEYEFLPYIPFLSIYFKLFKIKYIVDYDDAIFHVYDQNSNLLIKFFLKRKISKVIKHSSAVITGSPYLTRYALNYNKNVFEIPTSIDFDRYFNSSTKKQNTEKFIIGWIGSKTTSKNLLFLIPTFNDLKNMGYNFQINLIGFDEELKENFKNLPVKFIDWKKETEIKEVSLFSVGIMPLENNLFNKGKCAFKLIQYMACGIPTISSKFEANIKVDRNNDNFFANTQNDWKQVFQEIFKNKNKLEAIGERNKQVIKEHYSIQANNRKYQEVFLMLNN